MHLSFRPRATFLACLATATLAACGGDGTGPGDDGDGNGTALTSGTPVGGRSGDEGNTTLYRITVPNGATLLTVTTTGGTGDVDLYVREGQAPTVSSYDCESAGGANEELCEMEDPAAGTWYIMLEAFEDYSGVTLTATVSTESAQPAVCGGDQGGNLVGDWRRAGDFGAPNAAGMLVRHADGEGVIVANPGTGFAIGEVKWYGFNPTNCTIQSLFTNEAGTIQEYQSVAVSLNAAETQLTMGEVIYNRE
jgi:bacterial leucyl aminopeptidase